MNQLVYQRVVAAFGNEILQETEEIDRAKLGSIIFSSAEARRKLNSITHPAIIWEALKDLLVLNTFARHVHL